MKKENRKVIIGIIIIGAFISSLNQTVMTSALPSVMKEFGINAGVGQWLTTAYLLFLGVMIPCTGYMMEKISVKKLYISSVSLFLAGCILAVLSKNFYMLLCARVVQAFGAGILLPLPQVVTFRLYEPEKRGTIMGIVGLTTGFGPALGPTFAGWVVDQFNWRTIYYVMGALSVLSILLALNKLSGEEIKSDDQLDFLSVVLSTLGFSGLLIGVTNQGNYGITSVLTLAPFLIGVVCIAFFVRRQFQLKTPLLELNVFRYRNFTFGTVLLIFAYGSMLSVSTLIALYIQTCRGYSATMSGLIILPGALLLAFLNPVTGKILDRKGPFLLTFWGLFFLGGGTLCMAFMEDSAPMWMVGCAYAVRMLGIVSLLQPLMTWSVNSIPDRYVSHGTAIMNTVRQVGGAIISSVFISVMTSVSRRGGDLKGIQTSFIVTAVVVFFCMAVVVLTMRDTDKETVVEDVFPRGQDQLVITIAREYGSGGHAIGQQVAEKLGIRFYDNELIGLEAEESGFSQNYVKENEENASLNNRIYHYALKNYETVESNLYNLEKLAQIESVYQIQEKVMKKIVSGGPCVIVGRCADYILKNYPKGLHVFIKADWNYKSERIVEEYGIDRGQTKEFAKKKDAARAQYYKCYTKQEWKNQENYHMVLDSGILGIDTVVRLITEAAQAV